MKIFASLLFGTAALIAAALATAPAEARSGVAVQISPGGIVIGVDQYRDNCRDYSYRHRYYDNCNRYSFNDAYYRDRGDDYRWQQRHHRRHHHHDRDDNRWNSDRDYRNNDNRWR